MAGRASTVERDDEPLFVKDGVPVKFCFHNSVKEGKGQITRDVERHGGEIVASEKRANVLLVDEQQNLGLLRRKYYSSTRRYRLLLYVEPRGFVRQCIRSGTYVHLGPIKQGMPGRAPGGRAPGGRRRIRVAFTEEDRNHLAYYLATRFPTRDGRFGNNAYKDLEQLGQTDDPSWAWARRHTFLSWREHYKMNPDTMDARINVYLDRLKDVGHHHGHDQRRHDYRELRQEEEEESDEAEEQRQGIPRQNNEGREPQEVHPRAPAREAQDYLLDEEDEESEREEDANREPQRVKRRRIHPDAHLRHGAQEAQVKRPRVLETSSNKRMASDIEAGRGESISEREDVSDDRISLEMEDSDLFGDREYGSESPSESDSSLKLIEFPMPLSPKVGQIPAPPSTQATLVASPPTAHKGKEQAPDSTSTGAVERIVVQRARVRGPSAQPGPFVLQKMRKLSGVATVEGAYRAQSRSVEPQPWPVTVAQPPRQQEDKGGRGKGKAREEVVVRIEEDVQIAEGPGQKEAHSHQSVVVTGGLSTRDTFEDEMVVEGLLQTGAEVDEDGESKESLGGTEGDDEISDLDDDEDDVPELPRFQDVEIGSDPTDSDDAETHVSLMRGAVREGSGGEGGIDAASERRPDHNGAVMEVREGSVEGDQSKPQPTEDEDHKEDSDSDDADADRIESMARRSLRAAPEPRVTRSRAAAQAQTQTQTYIEVNPSRTRSGRARALQVGKSGEGRRTNPGLAGSRTARAVRGRVKRG